MNLPTTAALAAAFAAIAVLAGWRGARPPDVTRGPRLVPWRLIMVTAALAAILLIAHAMTLLGIGPSPS